MQYKITSMAFYMCHVPGYMGPLPTPEDRQRVVVRETKVGTSEWYVVVCI